MPMKGTDVINGTSAERDTTADSTVNPYAVPLSLTPVWIACHYARKLAKKQVVEANIRTAVEQIALFTQRSDTSLRVTGGLLVGVAKLYARKVEYFHLECCGVLQRLQNSEYPYFGKLRGSGIAKSTLRRALTPPSKLDATSGDARSLKTCSRVEETHSSPSQYANAPEFSSVVSATLMQAELAQEDRDFHFLEETLARKLNEDTSDGATALCALSRELGFNVEMAVNDKASAESPDAADSELHLTTHDPVEPPLKDVQYFLTDTSMDNTENIVQRNNQGAPRQTMRARPTHKKVVDMSSFATANTSPNEPHLFEPVEDIPPVDDGFTPLSLSDVGVYVRSTERPLETPTTRPAAFGVNDVPGPIERLRGIEGPVLAPHTMALTPGRQAEYGAAGAFYHRRGELSTPLLRPMTTRRARESDAGFDDSSGRQRDSLESMDPSPELAMYSPMKGDAFGEDSITRNLAVRTPGFSLRPSVASDATDHPFCLPLSPNGTPFESGLQPFREADEFSPNPFTRTCAKNSPFQSTSSAQPVGHNTSGKQATAVEGPTASTERPLVTRANAKHSVVRRRLHSAASLRSWVCDDETVLSDSILHSWRQSLTDILRQPETETVKKQTSVLLSERLGKIAEWSTRPQCVSAHTQNVFVTRDETPPFLSCDGTSGPIDQASTPLLSDVLVRVEGAEEEPQEEAVVVCGVHCDTDYDTLHRKESINITTSITSTDPDSVVKEVCHTDCVIPLSSTLEESPCLKSKKSSTDEPNSKELLGFSGSLVHGALSSPTFSATEQSSDLSEAAELQHALYGEEYPLFIRDPLSSLETNSASIMMRTPFKTPFAKPIQRCDTETTVTPLRSPLSPVSETSWDMRVTPHTPLKPCTPVAYADNKSPVEVNHAVAQSRPIDVQDNGSGTTAVIKKKDIFLSSGPFDTLIGEVGFSKRTIRILQYVYNKLHHGNFHARRFYTAPCNASPSEAIVDPSSSTGNTEYHHRNAVPWPPSPDTCSVPVLSFSQLMTGQPRNSVAATFFELMALKTRDYIDLIVDKASLDGECNEGDILIAATNRLEALV